MEPTTFRFSPISPDQADDLRSVGGPIYIADQVDYFPCRQCLRDAEIGEELILVSHDPFSTDSHYRSASPIFLHREPCAPDTSTRVPRQLTGRQLSVRSFDVDEMMIDAAIIDGTELSNTIDRLFDTAEASRIHVHNASRGCWAVAVERA